MECHPPSPPPISRLQLWHLLLLERPFTEGNTPDSEPRHPGGRLGGFSDLGGMGGLGGGPIGGSVPAGIGGSMGGLVGSMEHWGPGRHPRLYSQRRYRSRGSSRPDRSPAVEGWVTRTPHPSPDDLINSTAAPQLNFFVFVLILRVSIRIVQQFLTGLFSNSGVPGSPPLSWWDDGHRHITKQLSSPSSWLSPLSPIRTGMLHSNPGDYAWGQGGLDAVITQVRTISQFPVNSILFYFPLNLMRVLHVSQLCLCSYLVSWKTQDPPQQKKRRFLPSLLSVYLRNKRVSHSVFSSLLGSSLST